MARKPLKIRTPTPLQVFIRDMSTYLQKKYKLIPKCNIFVDYSKTQYSIKLYPGHATKPLIKHVTEAAAKAGLTMDLQCKPAGKSYREPGAVRFVFKLIDNADWISNSYAGQPDDTVYMRLVDGGSMNQCWVVTNKSDPTAVKFVRED